MKYLFVLTFIGLTWTAFEMWRAPQMDDEGNVTKPGRKLKDLLK